MKSPALLHVVLVAAALLLSAPGSGPSPRGAARGPRVLVTNDDGIGAAGLQALVRELSGFAEVVVCAPDGNRSGSSHAVSVSRRPLVVKEAEIEGAVLARSVSGMPADAVSFGILELGKEKPFDLVVSGINKGANVGMVAQYSGTVGAAMEAVLRGVPAIAVSHHGRDRDLLMTARFTAEFVKKLRRHGAHPGVVYSINVPASKASGIEGVVAARMGGSYFSVAGYTKLADGGYRKVFAPAAGLPDASDTRAYLDHKITVTPLAVDWTDAAALRELEKWDLR